MKLLLENWKRFLNEGIDPRIQKQLDALLALPDDIGILIEEGPSMGTGNIMTFQYVKILGPSEFHRLHREDTTKYENRKVIKTGLPHGEVEIWKTDAGECLNGWAVLQSGAERGWGPLLYEVALEWASEHGGGLTSDRGAVSDYAMAVWDKYAARGDVTAKQMDVDHTEKWMRDYAELTPDVKVDDCDQGKAIDLKGDKWMDTSVSKMFYKDSTPVMDELYVAGRILEA
tara:strand:- start:8541 stop:9227 length:687 start_codon:yes stop_codon:yes gene_type:complete